MFDRKEEEEDEDQVSTGHSHFVQLVTEQHNSTLIVTAWRAIRVCFSET
jgi:hypothetical protein